MADKAFNQLANDPTKALTVQATLTAAIGVGFSHWVPSLTQVENGIFSSLLSLVIVWVGRRAINRADADAAVLEPTRAMVLLRDKTEQEALAMDDTDPRKQQRLDHAQFLTEQILLRTVETDYIAPTRQIPPPPSPPLESVEDADVS